MHNKLMDEVKSAKWEVPVGDKLKTFYLEDIFIIDETNLTQEFAQQASLYAYFSGLSAQLEYNLSLISTAKEQSYAEADSYYRADAVHNDKKITEAQVRAAVILDEEYNKYVESETEAHRDYKIVQGIVRALEQRANMLISLGSQVRHEANMDGMNIHDSGAAFVKDLTAQLKERKAVR